MDNQLINILLQISIMVGLSYPLGYYIAKVYKGEKTPLDFLEHIERFIYKIARINPNEEMNWKAYIKALLMVNLVWFIFGFTILLIQGFLPLNPDNNTSLNFNLAFNTAISFLVNCNLQHYSGESNLTYFSQLLVIMFFQFITAACGMAALAAIFKAMLEKTANTIGNFWVYLIKSISRILLPLSLIIGILLILNGVPMTFCGAEKLNTLEGNEQVISQGPVAAIVPIKQLGTNGGGFFATNSAHPLENTNGITNMIECCAIMLIPMAMIFALGFYLKKQKLAWSIFIVMFAAYSLGAAISIKSETDISNSSIYAGIDQSMGNMEGKENRIGAAASALWGATTTASSNGSVNSMHDSHRPESGIVQLLNMQINSWFGGVGVGFMNYYTYIIIAVFISGLMVGRTPELLGKKIEAREMKIATLIVLLHPFLILASSAITTHLANNNPNFANEYLSGIGVHQFDRILYEFTSSAANNGSGYEGLNDNNPFWNISTAIVLILGRYLPIIGQIAIAGYLAEKKYIPQGSGTLRVDSFTFSFITFAIIIIIAALSFFPAIALGPLTEALM